MIFANIISLISKFWNKVNTFSPCRVLYYLDSVNSVYELKGELSNKIADDLKFLLIEL